MPVSTSIVLISVSESLLPVFELQFVSNITLARVQIHYMEFDYKLLI